MLPALFVANLLRNLSFSALIFGEPLFPELDDSDTSDARDLLRPPATALARFNCLAANERLDDTGRLGGRLVSSESEPSSKVQN